MQFQVKVGDVLDEVVDVLICTGNSMLRMTGGVNGALLQRGALDIQGELEAYLKATNQKWVPPGTVVQTGPGPLAVQAVLHAVAVDGFYKSSVSVVAETLVEAFRQVGTLGAKTLATPALACGYGPLQPRQFAEGLLAALDNAPGCLEAITVVVRRETDAAAVREVLREAASSPDSAPS